MKAVKTVYGRVQAIQNHVVVSDMDFGNRITKSGLILPQDDATLTGIRARWARVYSVGQKQTDVAVGQYVLVKHGRWTRGVNLVDPDTKEEIVIRRIDVDDILLVTDSKPEEEYVAEGKWF